MKIATNDFGNYTRVTRPVQQPKAEPANSTAVQKQLSKTTLGSITEEEKKFFMGLYPENKDEVMNYHFYHKNGKMQGVTLGTIFDKRG